MLISQAKEQEKLTLAPDTPTQTTDMCTSLKKKKNLFGFVLQAFWVATTNDHLSK